MGDENLWDPRVPGPAKEVPFVLRRQGQERPVGQASLSAMGPSTHCWVRDRTVSRMDPAGRSQCRQKAGGSRVHTQVLTSVPWCFISHKGILSVLGNRA